MLRLSFANSFRKSAPHLVVLYADRQQIKQNCFIAQLYRTLNKHFRITPISHKALLSGNATRPSGSFGVLSLLKQRTWKNSLPHLEAFLNNSPIVFYDQDPWEAYHDSASSPGVYAEVGHKLNVSKFLVTSNYWAQFIQAKDNLPTEFVRMGILPEWCDAGPAFDQRPFHVGFQGTVHLHRRLFFERMKGAGIDVVLRPAVAYKKFLREIQKIQTFLHDETGSIHIDGIRCNLNGIWVKEVEVAARGCFAIRNTDKDIDAYGIGELPTVIPFTKEEEVPNIIDKIYSMPSRQREEMVEHTVSTIRQRNDWMTVVHALHASF